MVTLISEILSRIIVATFHLRNYLQISKLRLFIYFLLLEKSYLEMHNSLTQNHPSRYILLQNFFLFAHSLSSLLIFIYANGETLPWNGSIPLLQITHLDIYNYMISFLLLWFIYTTNLKPIENLFHFSCHVFISKMLHVIHLSFHPNSFILLNIFVPKIVLFPVFIS